ncbi:NAD-dependent epimerase/dehydratase family protein [Streptomyces rapamycinicus]|uniref:3-beta hydroxysteroid dehydrogenase n=2 Tax=Streptomyces rapamycinicus TaxID=1226757 RepID=A0A0A0NW39_STRRN|nr:NAD-dependent epimerase/dehydratase family protein [Streptomyces rapamycinicus]AGP59420.1 3-beta hydroxysteroid dehydrogenase [Streptomyces rapamycinicus NRRL 5491]MBB4787175.1 nucleoside-diphosphate-sugar epimerase [Streptomyces rapamycinicus]RLV77386.1 3-beta hydroxysteroid dehydrogenase [Streptomyces rapamycinicus NRRL 5491]UTO67140.1 NAD-dependent epimerase/dehydratase family protein [Streptomyces rapamycinicus]UTP35097.1 NAD-dependent epimerase/dehydratase family protein [Streptomyces 
MARAFVTGGSGFIGQVLVRRLLGEGHAVRVLVRSEGSAAKVSALGAEPVRGELTEPATWRNQVTGSDVVFHLAAETDITADRERHELVSVRGTRAAVDAARDALVPRFVHCGSEAALLAGDPLVDIDESAPLRPDSEAAYCAVKAVAERIVLDANAPGFATVSIRPRFVWGPGSILTEGLVAAARAGQFAWIDGGRHATDVTFVDNAVEGLVLGWRHGRPGQAYFVTDQHRVVLREFMEALFGIYGVDTPIPDLDAGTAAREVPVPARWFLGQPCLLCTDKAVAELGYKPIVSHGAGLDAVRNSVAAGGA